MQIQLSDHFSYGRLLRFVLPSIVMMIITSIYSVVDGLFVSNYVGTVPFAALNLVYPMLMGLSALGFMMGTGGSALVSKTLGQGDKARANRYFSMIVYATLLTGIVLAFLAFVFMRPLSVLLGAKGEAMIADCVLYGRINLLALPAFMLQVSFQSFLVTAEKPRLGLVLSLSAGVTNMVLDFLLVGVFRFGLVGAAWATAISQMVGGFLPFFYFLNPKNSSLLHLGKPSLDVKALVITCTNGSSELMSNLASSLVSVLYNFRLMALAGENGVAAYGVIMYVNFIFAAIFMGYAIGSAPVVGYHYGAEHHDELKSLLGKSLRLVAVAGLVLTALSELLARPLTQIFVGYDPELWAFTCHGFQLYSLSFLFSGFNVFGSSFFTALNNGLVSAGISFSRTLLFQVAAVLLLPLVLGVDGIWLAITVAELLCLLVTVSCLVKLRGRYHYA